MSDKSLSLPLRRIFGGSEAPIESQLEPVSAGPAPITGPDVFETETLRRTWLFLEQKRGDRAMLSRADIDPGELRHVLPRVALIEVHYAPQRYRMRLAGTQWTNDLGFDPTGKWLDQWPHEAQRQLLEASFAVTVAAKQAYSTRRHAFIDGVKLLFEAMILPLSPDGETVNMLLTISAPWRTDRTPATLIGKI